MVNQQILDYINGQLKNGVSREVIKSNLISQGGWTNSDIEEAFSMTGSANETTTPNSVVYQPEINPVKSNKFNKLFLIIPLIILLLAGGIFAYTKYFSKSPEQVLRKTIMSMQEINSFEYNLDIDAKYEYTYESYQKEGDNFKINVSGVVDDIDLKKDFKFSLMVNLGTVEYPDYVGLDARKNNDGFFLKLKLPFLAFFGLGDAENQWIKIEESDVSEVQSLGFSSEIEVDGVKESISPEKVEELKKAFIESDIFEVTENFGVVTYNDKKTYHYKLTLNKDNYVAFLEKVQSIIGSDEIDDELIQNLREELESVDIPESEVWIGKKDYLIYGIKTEIVKDSVYSKSQTITNITLDKYNEDFEIKTPENYKTLEELIGNIEGSRGFTE